MEAVTFDTADLGHRRAYHEQNVLEEDREAAAEWALRRTAKVISPMLPADASHNSSQESEEVRALSADPLPGVAGSSSDAPSPAEQRAASVPASLDALLTASPRSDFDPLNDRLKTLESMGDTSSARETVAASVSTAIGSVTTVCVSAADDNGRMHAEKITSAMGIPGALVDGITDGLQHHVSNSVRIPRPTLGASTSPTVSGICPLSSTFSDDLPPDSPASSPPSDARVPHATVSVPVRILSASTHNPDNTGAVERGGEAVVPAGHSSSPSSTAEAMYEMDFEVLMLGASTPSVRAVSLPPKSTTPAPLFLGGTSMGSLDLQEDYFQ